MTQESLQLRIKRTMKQNPIVHRQGKIFSPQIIINLVKNNQKIDRTFQTVVNMFRHMVIVNNLQRLNNAYMVN